MSTITVRPSAAPSKIPAVALAMLATLTLPGCLLAVDDAVDATREVATTVEALTQIEPPDNWTGLRIYIGRTSSGIFVAYQEGISGAGDCADMIHIGTPSGLFERTRVHGTSGIDEIRVIGGSSQVFACGTVLTGIPANSKLEIYGWAGNDRVYATGTLTNLQVYGVDGDDMIVVGEAHMVSGANGSDLLFAQTGTNITMTGDNHSDVLCVWQGSQYLGGGSGTDTKWLGGANPSGGFFDVIEQTTTQTWCNNAKNIVTGLFGD